MSDLDEVSLSIGRLSGQVEYLNQNMEHFVNRIEAALTNHVAEDKKNFDRLDGKVASLDKFKTRVYAFSTFMSVVFTAGFNYLCSRNHG